MGKYFGTDGIRGVANEGLTPEIAYKVGRFLGDYTRKKGNGRIVIGKDTRLSSSMLENMLSAGIAASGGSAYQIGYCSTPCLAYVANQDEFDLGIMISASHNPYYDNGIKVFGNNGIKLAENVEKQVEAYIDNPEGIPMKTREEIGLIWHYEEGLTHYKDWIKELYPTDLNGIKILIDCANGSNSAIAYEVLLDLGATVTAMNYNPNGININEHCGSTHLEMLQEKMEQGDYDIGFAFDGDADRLQMVNRDGKALNGDFIMYILAFYLKEKGLLNKDKLVVTGYSNIGLHKALNKHGVSLDVVENGDKYVLESMLKNGYGLGGEQSGHIIIGKDCNFGDGLKSGLCVLEAMKYFGKSVDELIEDLIIYPQLQVNVKVTDKKTVAEDKDIIAKVKEIAVILGNDGQILVRPSGTEPIVRVMVEASSNELCEKYVDEVIKLIRMKGYEGA